MIQPIFLLSCYKIGFSVSKKYGEKGCQNALIQISYIIAFASVIAVIEFATKNKVFYSNGPSWQAFRAVSIYGYAIRLGTSLTIGLAIYAYLYQRSWRRLIWIILAAIGIYACGSRSSRLVCVATVGLAVFAVYRKKITKSKLFHGAIIAVFIIAFIISTPGPNMMAFINQRVLRSQVTMSQKFSVWVPYHTYGKMRLKTSIYSHFC